MEGFFRESGEHFLGSSLKRDFKIVYIEYQKEEYNIPF